MQKKFNVVNLLIIMYFFLISFVLLNIFQVTYEQNQINKLNSDFLSSDAISFKVNSKKAIYAEDIIEFLDSSKANHFALQYQTEESPAIFYYEKGFNDKPPMIEGSFFTNKDYSLEPSIVRGRKANISNKNIQGIMGYEIESNLDTTSFINFSKNNEKHKVDEWGYFSIDGFGKDKAYNLLKENEKFKGITEINKNKKTLDTLGMVLLSPIVLYPIILLIFMSTSLIIIDEYCYYRKKEYRVKKLIGVSNFTLIRELLFELMILAGIGILLGNILNFLFIVNLPIVVILLVILAEILITGIINLYYSYKMTKVSGVWRNE